MKQQPGLVVSKETMRRDSCTHLSSRCELIEDSLTTNESSREDLERWPTLD